MRNWDKADLVHATNLQKLLMKLKYDLDAKGVVETYHAFNWIDKITEEIETALNNSAPESFEEAIQTAEIKPNDESKSPVKPTKRTSKSKRK